LRVVSDVLFVLRCCLFDTDPVPIDTISNGRLKNLLKTEYAISGKEGGVIL
jgi:hypothetical protein